MAGIKLKFLMNGVICFYESLANYLQYVVLEKEKINY